MSKRWWLYPIPEHWENRHTECINDFIHWYSVRNYFKIMLRKHPDDEMTENFKSMLKDTEFEISNLKKEYKKKYGVNFNLRRIE